MCVSLDIVQIRLFTLRYNIIDLLKYLTIKHVIHVYTSLHAKYLISAILS